MPVTSTSRIELELWNTLRRAQEGYSQTLARLDTLAFNDTVATDRIQIEDAGKARGIAYRKYRDAMDELLVFLHR